MMRRVLFVIIVAVLAGCSSAPDNQKTEPQVSPATTAAQPAAQDDAKWTVTEGISAPESVYVDADDGFIFVSNIVGAPDQRDGNGYISKLSPDGKVIAAMWVTGFNAPKGLRS